MMKYLFPITIIYYFALIIIGKNNIDHLFLYLLALILIIVSFLYEVLRTKKIINKVTLYMYLGITVTFWEFGFNDIVVGLMALVGLAWVIVLVSKKIKLSLQRNCG